MVAKARKTARKDSNVFATLERLIALLRNIPRNGRISASQLRERLADLGYDVTARTVQRDLNHLIRAFGISSDDAKPKGWFWPRDAAPLDMPGLDPHTALAFKMAEHHLKPLLPASTFDSLKPWFRAAGDVLGRKDGGFAGWTRKVRVLPKGLPLLPPKVDAAIQETLYEALFRGFQVRVRYRPADAGDPRRHVIHPMALVVRDQVAYLVCRMDDRGDPTQLVLNRFVRAELLEERAKGVAGFDIDEYIRDGEFGFPRGGGRIALDLRINRAAAIHFLENRLAADQVLVDATEDYLRFRATVQDTAEMRWWILSLGKRAEVLGPPALRKEIGEIAAEMHDKYAGGGR